MWADFLYHDKNLYNDFNLPTFSGVGGLSTASNPWECTKWEITHGKIIKLVPIEIGNTGEECIFGLKYMCNAESFDV